MDESRGGSQGRRLRAVGDGPVRDPATLQEAIAACATLTAAGIPVRALGAAVAEHLGVAPSAIAPRSLSVALGLMIACGRVDEVGGRLVPVGQEQRRAG